MKTWLMNWWDAFRTSFWFVPLLLGLAAILLAWLMPALDRWVVNDVEHRFGWTATTAAAARLTLSSIAGAMITVTGVVFSLTMVALANTASQFGSRLLRKLMEDVVTHLALGSLIATSLYCLLVLRVVRDTETTTFVPHLSVALSIVLALTSMGIFIFFIHEVALRLQAPNLTHAVALELYDAIDRLFPEKIGEDLEDNVADQVEECLQELGDDYTMISAQKRGYVQAVDGSSLMGLAATHDLVIFVPSRPGAFLSEESALVYVWPQKKIADSLAEDVRTHFIVGSTRTPRQDVTYVLNQLVEIAVRALSPGINDPFTAMTCLDYLGAGLVRLATRKIPSPLRLDKQGKVRVFAQPVTFALAVRTAFPMILHYACSNPAIVERLLQTIETLTGHLRRKDDKIAIREFLDYCREMIDESTVVDSVQTQLINRCEKIQQKVIETVDVSTHGN